MGVAACSGEGPAGVPPHSWGTPSGPEGGGSPGPALTMMPPPHDLPLPGLQQLRTAGTAAPPPPYTGGGTGALGRAAPPETIPCDSVRLHKFACVARICILLHRCGSAVRQPAGCIGGVTEEQHPPGPPRSLPRRGHGRPGSSLGGRAWGHKGWSYCACRSWQRGIPLRGRGGTFLVGVLLVRSTIQALTGRDFGS